MNYTNLINTENYVEELCLDYVPQLNTSFMFIILLNIIYFLFLNVLISKIEHKRINSYISNITITILLCANSYLLCYYFIFNHNNIIFDNLELIKKRIQKVDNKRYKKLLNEVKEDKKVLNKLWLLTLLLFIPLFFINNLKI